MAAFFGTMDKHNIACNLQHEGMAEWFCYDNTTEEWVFLLWIHENVHAS
jgi:hypothetical protein